MKNIYAVFLLAGAMLSTAPAATLTIPNGGALIGAPGDLAGWDFTIESTPVQDGAATVTPWLLISYVEFIPDPGLFPVGVFTAYLELRQNSAVVVGPDSGTGEVNSWSQPFHATLQTGLGEYRINGFQSPGDAVTGRMVVYYDAYRESPNSALFDPGTDTLEVGLSMSAPVSVTVTGDAPVPEPALPLASGLVALALRLRRR